MITIGFVAVVAFFGGFLVGVMRTRKRKVDGETRVRAARSWGGESDASGL